MMRPSLSDLIRSVLIEANPTISNARIEKLIKKYAGKGLVWLIYKN